jgi:endonuclease/exonuclease/phosphatase family metal-dependent hydrolase
VVTWNVAGGMPLAELETDSPDVAFLQEIGGIPPGRKRPRYFETFSWLGDLDPGTLSRGPMERLPTKRVGPWQEPQVLRTSIAGRKVILVNVRLALPAFVVAVASLETPSRLVAMHGERMSQFVQLRDLVVQALRSEGTTSAVLCGDFNSPGGIQSSQPMRTILRDVWPEGGRGWGATMPAWLPMSRIDQCWVTPDIEVVRAVVRKGNSDHRRLVVDLAFR